MKSTSRMSVIAMLLGFLVVASHAHKYKTGECPSVEPMTNFNMNQFLGIWYAIQKTDTASSCVVYNITETDEPGEWNIQQLSQHFALGLVKHDYSYTGTLKVQDKDLPSKMMVKFPLNIAGSSTFTVFSTDYTTSAGIFSCQKLPASHRESATLLSRTKTLDKAYIDKLRNKLAASNVDPFDLSIINQEGCPKLGDDSGLSIHIDQETFSAASVGNAVRKVGSKVGDGVEYAVDGIKKLYHQIASSVGDKDSAQDEVNAQISEISGPTTRRVRVHNPDAEWIAF